MDLQSIDSIVLVAIEFSSAVFIGMLGALTRILNNKTKESFGSVISELVVAIFISITAKLLLYDMGKDFLVMAFIGVLCFNSKAAITVLTNITTAMMKINIQDLMKQVKNESGYVLPDIDENDISEEDEEKDTDNFEKLVEIKKKKRYEQRSRIKKTIDERKRKSSISKTQKEGKRYLN